MSQLFQAVKDDPNVRLVIYAWRNREGYIPKFQNAGYAIDEAAARALGNEAKQKAMAAGVPESRIRVETRGQSALAGVEFVIEPLIPAHSHPGVDQALSDLDKALAAFKDDQTGKWNSQADKDAEQDRRLDAFEGATNGTNGTNMLGSRITELERNRPHFYAYGTTSFVGNRTASLYGGGGGGMIRIGRAFMGGDWSYFQGTQSSRSHFTIYAGGTVVNGKVGIGAMYHTGAEKDLGYYGKKTINGGAVFGQLFIPLAKKGFFNRIELSPSVGVGVSQINVYPDSPNEVNVNVGPGQSDQEDTQEVQGKSFYKPTFVAKINIMFKLK